MVDHPKSVIASTGVGSSLIAPIQASESPSPSDAELERAIVNAVLMGRGDVASTLATSLEERRRARTTNLGSAKDSPRIDALAVDTGSDCLRAHLRAQF